MFPSTYSVSIATDQKTENDPQEWKTFMELYTTVLNNKNTIGHK